MATKEGYLRPEKGNKKTGGTGVPPVSIREYSRSVSFHRPREACATRPSRIVGVGGIVIGATGVGGTGVSPVNG